QLLAKQCGQTDVHASVATSIWLLVQRRDDFDLCDFRDQILAFFERCPTSSGIGVAISDMMLRTKRDSVIWNFGELWIRKHSQHPQACQMIVRLLTTGGAADTEARALAITWVEENKTHPQAYQLIAPLLTTGGAAHTEARALAITW